MNAELRKVEQPEKVQPDFDMRALFVSTVSPLVVMSSGIVNKETGTFAGTVLVGDRTWFPGQHSAGWRMNAFEILENHEVVLSNP